MVGTINAASSTALPVSQNSVPRYRYVVTVSLWRSLEGRVISWRRLQHEYSLPRTLQCSYVDIVEIIARRTQQYFHQQSHLFVPASKSHCMDKAECATALCPHKCAYGYTEPPSCQNRKNKLKTITIKRIITCAAATELRERKKIEGSGDILLSTVLVEELSSLSILLCFHTLHSFSTLYSFFVHASPSEHNKNLYQLINPSPS